MSTIPFVKVLHEPPFTLYSTIQNVLEELHQEDWEEQETPDTIEDDGADTSTGTESDGAGLKVDGDNANLSQSCKNPMLKRFVSVLNGRLHSVGEVNAL